MNHFHILKLVSYSAILLQEEDTVLPQRTGIREQSHFKTALLRIVEKSMASEPPSMKNENAFYCPELFKKFIGGIGQLFYSLSF